MPPGCVVVALNRRPHVGMLGWVAGGENKPLAMKQETSLSKDVGKPARLFCLHVISISSSVLLLTRKPRIVSAVCFQQAKPLWRH